MDIEILETELNRLVADKEKLENNITRLEIELKKCMQQTCLSKGTGSACDEWLYCITVPGLSRWHPPHASRHSGKEMAQQGNPLLNQA